MTAADQIHLEFRLFAHCCNPCLEVPSKWSSAKTQFVFFGSHRITSEQDFSAARVKRNVTRRVTRCVDHTQPAEHRNVLIILEDHIGGLCWNTWHHQSEHQTNDWIVDWPACQPLRHHARLVRTGLQARAAHLFKFRRPARVVRVRMREQNAFEILRFVSEFRNRLERQLRPGLGEARIDQGQAGGCNDQVQVHERIRDLIHAIGNLEHEPPYLFCPVRAYKSSARCEKRTAVSEFLAYTRGMKWLEQTLANQVSVIAHLHSNSSSQSDSTDLALVCSDLELIAWNGQTEQRLLLREVKKCSREGLDLLVFAASGEALRLPILSAPRAEIDAFFAALKPAIARARVAPPVAPKSVEPAPIVSSEFKLELSPEPVQVSQVVSQVKTVVLEPEKEMSFDLGPLMAPADTPATPAPRIIAEPAPQAEMVFDLGPLITPVSAPKPAPAPQPKIESAPVLEPKTEAKIEPVVEPEIKPVFAEEAVQAWPEVFAENIEPAPPVKPAAMQITSTTKQTVQPMAEIRQPPASEQPQPMPERSSPQHSQQPVHTPTASSSPSPMVGAEVVTPVGRDQTMIESKKPEMFDPLIDAPKPKRELPPRVLAQDFGNGLFMHENGFKYQLATVGERFLAMLVDGVLLGILNRVIDAFAYGGIRGKLARLQELPLLEATTSDLTKSAAIMLELETLKRGLPGELLQAALASFVFNLLAAWLYYAFFEASEKQGTPGKNLMKIGVTDLSIARINFMQASRRFAWRFGPFLATITIAFVALAPKMFSGTSDMVSAGITFSIWMLVSILAFLAGLLTAGFTKRRQAVHDLLAQTLVVKA